MGPGSFDLSNNKRSIGLLHILTPMTTFQKGKKEYVASSIGLYKNNGAVSCVGIDFHLCRSLYHARTQLVHEIKRNMHHGFTETVGFIGSTHGQL